jgi:prepilin-type N-terminal cleavage/methylation domain-containing protein
MSSKLLSSFFAHSTKKGSLERLPHGLPRGAPAPRRADARSAFWAILSQKPRQATAPPVLRSWANPSSADFVARDSSGFTLIEVIIVMVILVFISLGIYQLTTETYRLRESLAAEGEFHNSIRMAMDVVQRDVSAMFSPILSRPEPAPSPSAAPNSPASFQSQQELAALAASDQGKTSSFWLGATEKSGLRASRFVGTATKMSFISASHIRIYRDRPESDFAKVTYELVRSDYKEFPDTFALLKIANPDAFDDDDRRSDKNAGRYLLLHGIKSLRFRYWRKDKDNGIGKWETSWDSDKEDFREKYPDKVEITLEVIGPERLSHTGIYTFRPEVPLRGLNPST